ncbi:MAG: hypothetical protein H7836_13450 [Magnetococcus sp. YQC-3]
MSAKDAQKRRSQTRAARKRAKSKSGPRSRAVVMSQEGFRRLAAPVVSGLAKKNDLSEEVVAAVMEEMVEEGLLGLDEHGLLAVRKAVPGN